MASLSDVESVVSNIASSLSTSVKTKFTNTDSGYAAANGSFTNNVRFSVLHVDETKNIVCNLTGTNGDYVEVAIRQSVSNITIGKCAAAAYNAAQ